MGNQEKRFIVISPSHHKKPRTMFLNKTNSGKCVWLDSVPYITTLWFLSDARAFAASSPVAIWFVEDKDWISLLEAEDMPKFKDILKYAEKAECEIIRYKPEDMIPPIVAPSEQALADEALREIAQQLKNNPTTTTIYCKNNGEPIGILPNGERDDDADYIYLLYTETADGQITYYRSENAKATFRRKNQEAEIFKRVEAQAKSMFPDEDGRMWHMEMVSRVVQNRKKGDTVGTVEMREKIVGDSMVKTMTVTDENGKSVSSSAITPLRGKIIGLMEFQKPADDVDKDLKVIPLPKTQKQVAYALCDYIDGEPSYFCAEYAELYIKRGKENVQVFRTHEEAEFYNKIYMARHPNQSEMYVREIEF